MATVRSNMQCVRPLLTLAMPGPRPLRFRIDRRRDGKSRRHLIADAKRLQPKQSLSLSGKRGRHGTKLQRRRARDVRVRGA